MRNLQLQKAQRRKEGAERTGVLKPTRQSEIKRDWHLVDAKGQILGRLATVIAGLLMGKTKPYFVRHLDCGDFVVVINAKDVKVTGKKEKQKIYTRYSGYPGGLKRETLGQLRKVSRENNYGGSQGNATPK
ncbi:MAG: large subunit ribosomal protein L13 [Microgenomates group bacterium LiPW_16]|nr:MAG: large subunit ribosomal protein L13 [Microgenomates group bacterium LiPW_16]